MTKINSIKGMAMLMLFVVEIAALPLLLRAFIYSVAIPVFFMACGYESNQESGFSVLKKKSVSLLAPYAVTCIFSVACCLSGVSKAEPSAVISHITPVWTVFGMYAVSAAYAFLSGAKKNITMIAVSVLILMVSLGGMILGMKGYALFLGADVIAAMFVFVLFGDLLRRCDRLLHKLRYIVFPAAAVVWSVLVYFGRWMELPIRAYRGHVLCVACVCAGCVALLGLAMLLEKCKAVTALFEWCGQNAVIGLCLAGYVQLNVDWMDIYPFIPTSWMEDALFRIITCLFVMLCIVLFSNKVMAMNRE